MFKTGQSGQCGRGGEQNLRVFDFFDGSHMRRIDEYRKLNNSDRKISINELLAIINKTVIGTSSALCESRKVVLANSKSSSVNTGSAPNFHNT
jgi:hypothetical protein